jgi:hypothetical protein
MRFVVASHGHCFDGLSSAVLFTRLIQSLHSKQVDLEYRACGYGTGQLKADDSVLTGDDNAILDYRFWPSSKLSWYFDHHRTAFQGSADRAVFDAREAGGKYFFDATYSSCTRLIADVAREQFGLVDPTLTELVRFADVVDSARFESPERAIDRSDPLMRLVSVVEHYGDDAFYKKWVPELLQKPLSELSTSGFVNERYRPLGQKHERFIERVRNTARLCGRVVFVDLTEGILESVGKFVTYALYPESVYSVIVGRLKNGPKISVGYNPWSGKPLDVDISAICARFGGGGHPVVGGIAFATNEVDRARVVARQIADELAG